MVCQMPVVRITSSSTTVGQPRARISRPRWRFAIPGNVIAAASIAANAIQPTAVGTWISIETRSAVSCVIGVPYPPVTVMV